MKIDKQLLLDTGGRPLTQSLFLEFNYNVDYAVFTFDDEDKMYKGKLYPSLKKLYLETADPTEYIFAKKYLLGWSHWKRLNENKALKKHFDEWREELEISLRSEGVQAILEGAADNFQAAKWLADKGWEKRSPGRPSKEEQEREERIIERVAEDLNGTIARMEEYRTGS